MGGEGGWGLPSYESPSSPRAKRTAMTLSAALTSSKIALPGSGGGRQTQRHTALELRQRAHSNARIRSEMMMLGTAGRLT